MLEDYIATVELAEARRDRLTAQIEAMLPDWTLAPRRAQRPQRPPLHSTVPQDSGDEVADAVKDPPDVDAHYEFPIAGRHVDQPGAVHRYSGVVAGDVQLAESALGFRERTDDGLLQTM